MKDVSKLISDKATRFIPVDMKDRLKTVFNRAGKTQPPVDDDVPDYTAIFNANKSPNQKKARFNGPLEPAQLSAPDPAARIADHSREHEIEIEEAEIVADAAPAQSPGAQRQQESHRSEPAPVSHAKASRESRWQPQEPQQPRETAAAAVPEQHHTQRPSQNRQSRPEPRPEARDAKKAEARRPEPRQEPEIQPEEHRPNARFESGFETRMAESARLKIEPHRSEPPRAEYQAEEPQPVVASSGYYRAPEPARPERESAGAEARDSEEHMAAAFSYEDQPLEQPRDTYRASGQSAPRASESPERTLHQQKESSMQAKAQESIHENGQTTLRTDAANIASIAIERNSKFSGQLKFSGAVAIDGQVEGEIVAERVVIHEGGVVNATVEGNTIVVAGTVKGDVYARGELEILASGVVHGSVTTPQINVRRGGRIDGRCAIGAPRQ